MASDSWMDRSLRRSAKLGHEVLEKAKRRSVNRPCAKPSPVFSHTRRDSERDFSHSNLDHAFATIVEYMAETTRQCKKFYKSVHPTELHEREHVCRYHSQKMLRTSPQKQTVPVANNLDIGSTDPEDFLIEVAPGIYSITAAMQDEKPLTKTVCVTAGESQSLTFNL